jgi:hypothetical protein
MWIGLGAAMMYYLDPDRGRSRRARARDRVIHVLNEIDHEIEVTSRDLANRTQGLVARSTSLLAHDGAPEAVIAARVRSKLGRVVSHPHAIEVTVRGHHVTLSGPVLAHEVPGLISAVKSVRGVRSVEDRLQVFERPGDHPALQGGKPRRRERFEMRPRAWSPTTRLLAGTAIGAAALEVAGRRGLAVLAIGALGAGLVATLREDGRRGRGPSATHARAALATGAPVGDVTIPIRRSRMQEPDLGL